MEPKTIVAIEIASSKIKGAAGNVGPDGRITVLAVEEIAGLNNVRYGRVQNIREVSAAVNEIIRRLENAPGIKPRKVRALAVSLGGRSLSGAPAQAAQNFQRNAKLPSARSNASHLRLLTTSWATRISKPPCLDFSMSTMPPYAGL